MAEMEYGNIISIEALAPDIYSMWIRCRAAYTSRPGQFIPFIWMTEYICFPDLSVYAIMMRKKALYA